MPSSTLNEFLIHLLQCFPGKTVIELAHLARTSQPDLCSGTSLLAINARLRRIREEAKKSEVSVRDIAIAKKLFNQITMPQTSPQPIDYEKLKVSIPEKRENAVQKKPVVLGKGKR